MQRTFSLAVVRRRIGRFSCHPLVHQEVNMGRAVSVLLFCVAMDPIHVVLNVSPGVLSVKGYMDNNATLEEFLDITVLGLEITES